MLHDEITKRWADFQRKSVQAAGNGYDGRNEYEQATALETDRRFRFAPSWLDSFVQLEHPERKPIEKMNPQEMAFMANQFKGIDLPQKVFPKEELASKNAFSALEN